MQISEVRKLKLELEGDIANSIRRLIVTFENATDTKIDLLTLESEDVTSFYDDKRRLEYYARVDIKI